MKGKMTTGAGKPSRSEPWKQTPESRPPQVALSLEVGRRGRHPHSHLFLPLPLRSGLQTVGEQGWWWQGPSVREAMSSTGSQGCFSSPPGDLSYFWERSEVTFRAEGERKGGACSLWWGRGGGGGGAKEAWRFDLPSA